MEKFELNEAEKKELKSRFMKLTKKWGFKKSRPIFKKGEYKNRYKTIYNYAKKFDMNAEEFMLYMGFQFYTKDVLFYKKQLIEYMKNTKEFDPASRERVRYLCNKINRYKTVKEILDELEIKDRGVFLKNFGKKNSDSN